MPTDSCDRLTADDLARMPLFADDDRAALEWLADHFEVRTYEPGEIIVREGSPAKDFIVILEGELGRTHCQNVGAWQALCRPGPRTQQSCFSGLAVGDALGRSTK